MKKYSHGDPYSPNLAYFMTEVIRRDRKQLTLMREFSKIAELRPCIKMTIRDNMVMGFEVVDRDRYDAEKKRLGVKILFK